MEHWKWKSGGGSVWIAGPVVKIRDRGPGGRLWEAGQSEKIGRRRSTDGVRRRP